MIILGVSGGPRGSHEPSITIIKDNKIICALQEERFNRFKNSISCFPYHSLKAVFKRTTIKPKDIDVVAHPGETYEDMKIRWKNFLNLNFGINAQKYIAVNHQLCHANAGYYSSNLDDALIISLDGVGDQACGLVLAADKKNKKIKKIIEFSKPLEKSIGFFWDAITQIIGFESLEEAYKTMGLAPYGKPIFNLSKFLSISNGIPKLNKKYINDQWKHISYHPLEQRFTKKLLKDLNFKRRLPIEKIRQIDSNLASSAQIHLERITKKLFDYYLTKTGKKNVVFTGGVALNSKMCGYLNEVLKINNFYVPQVPSDGGLSLGAAIEAIPVKRRNKIVIPSPYLGFQYSNKEIITALKYTNKKIFKYRHEQIIKLLLNDGVIGFFCNKSEFGPRALGARSIIALPKNKKMKDIVNLKIKFRENFRPFAPVIREIDFDKYFERGSGNYEFMNYVVKAKDITKKNAPAIVHEDGTSRVQILYKGKNKLLYDLLSILKKQIGTGILLNTSFNLKGEPIVENPTDAIRTFFSSGLDALVLEKYMISK